MQVTKSSPCPTTHLSQPVLKSLDECSSVNLMALEAHDSAMQGSEPNYGRLMMSYVYYGWVHDSLPHVPTPPHLSVDLQVGLLSNRATALRDMGSYRKATAAFDKVLNIQERLADPRRIDTLINVSNLHLRAGVGTLARESALQAALLAGSLHKQCKQAAEAQPQHASLAVTAESKLLNALSQVFTVFEAHATEIEDAVPDEAEAIRNNIVRNYAVCLGETHPETVQARAVACNNIGMMRRNAGHAAHALDAFALACEAASIAKMDKSIQGIFAGRLAEARQIVDSGRGRLA